MTDWRRRGFWLVSAALALLAVGGTRSGGTHGLLQAATGPLVTGQAVAELAPFDRLMTSFVKRHAMTGCAGWCCSILATTPKAVRSRRKLTRYCTGQPTRSAIGPTTIYSPLINKHQCSRAHARFHPPKMHFVSYTSPLLPL